MNCNVSVFGNRGVPNLRAAVLQGREQLYPQHSTGVASPSDESCGLCVSHSLGHPVHLQSGHSDSGIPLEF